MADRRLARALDAPVHVILVVGYEIQARVARRACALVDDDVAEHSALGTRPLSFCRQGFP